jgi:hypothetical protein
LPYGRQLKCVDVKRLKGGEQRLDDFAIDAVGSAARTGVFSSLAATSNDPPQSSVEVWGTATAAASSRRSAADKASSIARTHPQPIRPTCRMITTVAEVPEHSPPLGVLTRTGPHSNSNHHPGLATSSRGLGPGSLLGLRTPYPTRHIWTKSFTRVIGCSMPVSFWPYGCSSVCGAWRQISADRE